MKKLPAWDSAFTHPQIGKQIIQTELDNSPKAIAYTIRGIQRKRSSIFQLEPRLEKLPVATLVVLSDGDTPVVECSRFLAQHIPRATLEIIPAKSHWTHLEAPEKFLSAVDQFVSRLAAG
jgi:pimeloyl-ACP methyl ester carboxylesterase